MELFLDIVREFFKFLGMNGIIGSMLIGAAASRKMRFTEDAKIGGALKNATAFAFLTMLIASIFYLAYPGYLDHVEPTIASLGIKLANGVEIYPALDTYTFHGLLYGPALYEIQSLLGFLPFDVIAASKIPGIAAFFIALFLALTALQTQLARSYLLICAPFGLPLFWSRAEPMLFLCVVLTLIFLLRKDRWRWLWIGGIGAVALMLKLHAVIYVACAVFLFEKLDELNLRNVLACVAGFSVATFALLYPAQISVAGYIKYINLAAGHGISPLLLGRNFQFLFASSLPLLYLFFVSGNRLATSEWGRLLMLFLFESVVCLVGAKAGAGVHHLIPFLPINAFFVDRIIMRNGIKPCELRPLTFGFFVLAMYVLLLIAPKFVVNKALSNRQYLVDARNELLDIRRKYKDLVMGVTDDRHYDLTFFRPYLEQDRPRQIDYAAYMDLNYAGVSDAPLVIAFNNCAILNIVLPKGGKAFSLSNYYNEKPLFSDAVRFAFAAHYHVTHSGARYDVYSCRLAGHVNLEPAASNGG